MEPILYIYIYINQFYILSIFVQQELEMEPAGVSGTVTISDHRSYIMFETLSGKNPTEIHSALSEVCGEFTVDRGTVSRWANRCCGGYVSIENDPRPGMTRTPIDE